MSKHTPLYHWHQEHQAKMLDFAGYLMPISYQGVVTEHLAVRKQAGLFDVSHMGEFLLSGKQAEKDLQFLTSNHVSQLKSGDCQYSLLLNEQGYPIDDMIVYKIDSKNFFLCVNAANIEKDFQWILSKLSLGTKLENLSEETGMIALQGPKSLAILQSIQSNIPQLKNFQWLDCEIKKIPVRVSKTGYTGELGFEFYLPKKNTLAFWESLIQAGEKFGLVAAGLGARDTLRLEMGYALYGHELSSSIDPIAANLEWTIAWEKDDFLGKKALLERKKAGYTKKVFALLMEEPGIPREGMQVYFQEKPIGKVLSGTQSPILKRGMASVLIDQTLIKNSKIKEKASQNPLELFVDIRGKMKKASLQDFPLIQRKQKAKK